MTRQFMWRRLRWRRLLRSHDQTIHAEMSDGETSVEVTQPDSSSRGLLRSFST